MVLTLTCSAALFSAVLGRFEDGGTSELSEREEGLLEGFGESDGCCSKLPDTAECTQGGIRRGCVNKRQGLGAGHSIILWIRCFTVSFLNVI